MSREFAPGSSAFGTLMAARARRRGAGHVRRLAVLGDGAPRIWNLMTRGPFLLSVIPAPSLTLWVLWPAAQYLLAANWARARVSAG